VPGEENALTHAALVRLARDPSSLPSPVLVVGPSRSGKSHLLDGVAHAWRGLDPPVEPRHTDARRLTLAHQRAQLDRAMAALATELADAPALLVDDVHELGGRTATEQLLCRVLETRSARGYPAVFACRVHPASTALSAGLAGRLIQGVVLRLVLPGATTRAALVRRGLLAAGLALAPALARRLADALPDPEAIARAIPLLERIARRSSLSRAHVDAVAAELGGVRPSRPESAEEVLRAIETHLALVPGSLGARRGPRRLERPRRLAMRIARDLGIPRPAVARALAVRVGSLDAALRRLGVELASDAALAAELDLLRGALGLV